LSIKHKSNKLRPKFWVHLYLFEKNIFEISVSSYKTTDDW